MREIVPTWTMAPVVTVYQALRGVSFLVAVTFAAEVGDVRRFAAPQQLMAFLGLVPSERTTGDRCGAAPLRRPAIIEHDGSYRGSVDLPIFGTYQQDLTGSAQGSPPQHPQQRLEGTGPAVRRDPGGRWGLTAQCGQAELCCHVMNADVWPHLRRHMAKRTSVDTELL
jgi:hypothetical protein